MATVPKVMNTNVMATPDMAKQRSTTDPSLSDSYWQQRLPNELLLRPGLQNMIAEATSMGCIDFNLPKKNSLAGGVLHHCINVVDSLFKKHAPMIWKIGFTHDCCWRWGNSLYGYGRSADKWSRMVVMYISGEPFGPAMLEAALIDRFGSNMDKFVLYKIFMLFVLNSFYKS